MASCGSIPCRSRSSNKYIPITIFQESRLRTSSARVDGVAEPLASLPGHALFSLSDHEAEP